jgi:hypothetical protein
MDHQTEVAFWNEMLKLVTGMYLGLFLPLGVLFLLWYQSQRDSKK